jgi:hypothetical protein
MDDSDPAKSPISEEAVAGLEIPCTPWLQDRPGGSAGWAAMSAGPCRVWLHGGRMGEASGQWAVGSGSGDAGQQRVRHLSSVSVFVFARRRRSSSSSWPA